MARDPWLLRLAWQPGCRSGKPIVPERCHGSTFAEHTFQSPLPFLGNVNATVYTIKQIMQSIPKAKLHGLNCCAWQTADARRNRAKLKVTRATSPANPLPGAASNPTVNQSFTPRPPPQGKLIIPPTIHPAIPTLPVSPANPMGMQASGGAFNWFFWRVSGYFVFGFVQLRSGRNRVITR